MMACVWAISSWGLGTRGTRGGRIVAVPVDCNRNHILSNSISMPYYQLITYYHKLDQRTLLQHYYTLLQHEFITTYYSLIT